jgi:hypothetical protein
MEAERIGFHVFINRVFRKASKNVITNPERLPGHNGEAGFGCGCGRVIILWLSPKEEQDGFMALISPHK